MTNLLALASPRIDPNDDLVEMLNELIEQAKSGSLRGVILASLWHDDTHQNMWSLGAGLHPAFVTGAIVQLQHDYCEHVRERRGS